MSEPFEPGKTVLKQIEQYGDRWSAYGASESIVSISDRLTLEEMREIDVFSDYDDSFLEKIRSDVSVAVWKPDSVLFEEGSYIDLAFVVLEGEVETFVAGIGKGEATPQPIFDATRTVLGDAETTLAAERTTLMPTLSPPRRAPKEITLLASMDFDMPREGTVRLGPGEVFGEIGALSGWPQSVTARTVTECRLVQIRINALRLMKRKSAALKERLDERYRERSLSAQLRTTPLLRRSSPLVIEALKDEVELVSCEPGETVLTHGDEPDALYLVRSGFLKLLQPLADGQIAVSYLSKGMTLGEAELLLPEIDGWQVSAESVEYSELVRIPAPVFDNLLRNEPLIEADLWASAQERIRESGFARRHIGHAEFLQEALDTGLVQGNSILVIDLESCTRCDDCVRACADTHEGRPRFVREGDKYANLLIAKSCYHCRDPVCLVGCPTGAIHRAGLSDVVEIEDEICIGCASCFRNCPYDAIVMHETGDLWPDDMIPVGLRGRDRQVASKCDLCADTGHGPACVSNCPQGCAYRVGSLEEFQRLMSGES